MGDDHDGDSGTKVIMLGLGKKEREK